MTTMNIIRTANFKTGYYYNPDHPIVIRKIINAGLGCVVQNMLNSGRWGIVSVHSDCALLQDFLREQYIGFIQMSGVWVDEELDKFISEESLLLPKVNEPFLKAIAAKYSQDAYIFAKNNKYFIKKTESDEVLNEGNVKEHFKQFYHPTDKFQFDTSKIKERHWILDRNIAMRSNLVAEKISKGKNAHVIVDDVKLKLRIPNPSNAFITWKKRLKYIGWEGAMVEEEDNFTPPGSSLSAYLPLM